jgi:glyoxylase-like metal-dependent hydrolase (beta-lactamase superfamily II)
VSRGAAAVVDPVGDPAPYLRVAKESGMAIKYVIDTHIHADHVSTGRELARAADAEYAGRTELATTAEDGAYALFESAERLRALPDYVTVLPGAFSGSVCGRGLSGNPTSTIGFERRFNRAFGIVDRDAFIQYMLRDTPPRPPDAERVRAQNLGMAQHV